ncbi:MAG: hypothetical protein ACKOXZ_00555, partial [Polynucleobacter victoriensis]
MKTIAIIGAGPVGLACASWILHKKPDAHVHLYDRLAKGFLCKIQLAHASPTGPAPIIAIVFM